MPEEAPAVQNWRLLIVACVLGLVVMVVYNLHISKVRRESQKEQVTAFRYDRNLDSGDVVADEDLIRVKIPRDFAESIGRLLEEDEKDTLAVNQKISRDVSKDDFAMAGHFTMIGQTGPAYDLDQDKVQITIPVDSKKAPGRVLRIGNHVNILGMLPTKQGTYKMYRIIEWLKVVAIGGQTDRRAASGSGSRNTAESGVRSYSTITVEVNRREPDVSLQWGNLQTYLRGPAVIEICPSRFRPKKGTDGVIAAELMEFTRKAATVSTGGFEEGSY